MAKPTITNQKDLEAYLIHLVREATGEAMVTTGREERQRQDDMDKLTKEFEKKGSKDEVDEAEEGEPSADEKEESAEEVPSADVKKPSEEKVARASLKDIIKTLNIMRSGRSTKDPEVRRALKSYVDALTTGEQQSLYAFLSGLSEMMVGGETGKEATDPHGLGLKTKPIEGDDDAPKPKVSVSVKEKEGTPEAPIVVGEHADKSKELSRLHELMRG